MNMLNSIQVFLTTVFMFLAVATSQASVVVPGVLQPGATYHLAFVTRDGRDATSANIADYNAFVQAQAALNPALTGTDMGVAWKAIGSTATVAARDNALVEAPVFLLNGSTKIADGFADMWDSSIDATLTLTQFAANSFVSNWTGTAPDGLPTSGRTLGPTTAFAMTGAPFTDQRWIFNVQGDPTGVRPLYALSQKLTVPVLGDFDVDGDVDGRDFLLWQRGGSPNGTPGGPVSAADLADWQANYGFPPLTATSTAVPEPGTLVLLIVVLIVVLIVSWSVERRGVGFCKSPEVDRLVCNDRAQHLAS